MRNAKDRRRSNAVEHYPIEDDTHEIVTEDRRDHHDRRIENLELEERQLLLSEMPWLTFYKLR